MPVSVFSDVNQVRFDDKGNRVDEFGNPVNSGKPFWSPTPTTKTKYALSQEGVASVRQLQSDLKNNNENIRNACLTLQNVVSGVGPTIGIFEEQLNALIRQVQSAQQTGEQGIEELSNKLGQLASSMDQIIAKGLS